MTDEFRSTFAKRVRAAKPRARKYDVWDDVISGLGLRVGTSGNRSFFVRRSVRGRIRSATIGSADTLTVPEARREARRLLATFIDPARNDTGPVLTRDEFYRPHVVAIIRLLMLTGYRAEKSSPSNGTGFAASASTFPIPSPGRARSGCRAPHVRSSPPSRATVPIARSCSLRDRQRGTSTTSNTNGTASAMRRACPACGFMTSATTGLR